MSDEHYTDLYNLFVDPQLFFDRHGVLAYVGYFVMHRHALTVSMNRKDLHPVSELWTTIYHELALEVWLDKAAPLLPEWASIILHEYLPSGGSQ